MGEVIAGLVPLGFSWLGVIVTRSHTAPNRKGAKWLVFRKTTPADQL